MLEFRGFSIKFVKLLKATNRFFSLKNTRKTAFYFVQIFEYFYLCLKKGNLFLKKNFFLSFLLIIIIIKYQIFFTNKKKCAHFKIQIKKKKKDKIKMEFYKNSN